MRYRLKIGKPVFGNLQRNWDEEQPAILAGTVDPTMRPHPLGVLIALGFLVTLGINAFGDVAVAPAATAGSCPRRLLR